MNVSIPRAVRSIFNLTNLEILILLSFLILWIVWPLRGTIAARNIALITGSIASIAWFLITRPRFSLTDFLPIALLLCVPALLLGIYIFNPLEPELQWDDLRGTWLRVTIEMFFACGLAKIYIDRPKYQHLLMPLMFIWPVIILLIFICQGIFTHSWFGEQFYIHIFKSKVGGVYFLVWSLIFSLAVFNFQLHKTSNLTQSGKTLKITAVILFLVCLLNYLFLSSLNAFITIFFALLVLSCVLITHYCRHGFGLKPYKVALVGIGFVSFLFAVTYTDNHISENKLTYFMEDVQFSINVKNANSAWKWDGLNSGSYPPINPENGRKPHGSTYERISWYLEGVEFLKSNPLGLGYTGQAFAHYMKNTYPGSRVTKTHSGWLDFALGVGVIGLALIWIAMFFIFKRALALIRNAQEINIVYFYALWSILIMMFIWVIAELSDREYIEHFFFMLAFFSIVCLPSRKFGKL